MHVPPFDDSRKAWDKYGRFYNGYGLFTVFDNGEVWVTQSVYGTPYMRRYYAPFNVSLASRKEIKFALYTPDGEPVPKTHLANTITSYLLDHDLRRVYALAKDPDCLAINYIRYHNGVYYPNAKVCVLEKDTAKTKLYTSAVRDLITVCQAHCAITNVHPIKEKPLTNFVLDKINGLLDKGMPVSDVFNALSECDRRGLASVTRYAYKSVVKYEYLTYTS